MTLEIRSSTTPPSGRTATAPPPPPRVPPTAAPPAGAAAGVDGAVAPNWDAGAPADIDKTLHLPAPLDRSAPPPPNEAAVPVGLDRFPYGSGDVPLVDIPPEQSHLHGGIGTPPEVAQLADAGVANAFSPEWQAFLQYAVAANGGMGDAENGYLAFSREFGFVRFKHPGFTPEQNRRIAAISLQTGWPLERLPGRDLGDDSFANEKTNDWVNDFIQRFDDEMSAFLADPTDELKMQSGSRNHYLLRYDPEHNRVFSAHWRKDGGFRGAVADNFDVIGPVLDGLSIASALVGMPYLSAGIQTAKQGLVTAVTGDFELEQGIAIATSWLGGPLKSTQLGQLLASPVGRAGVAIGTDLAADGELDAATLAGVIAPEVFRDLPGGPTVDLALQRGARVLAAKIDGRDVGLEELYWLLEPVVAGLARGDDAAAIRGRLQNAGVMGAPTEEPSWFGLLSMLSDDPEDVRLIAGGLATVADWVSTGELDSKQALGVLKDYFGDEIDALKDHIKNELEEFLGLRDAS